MTADKTKLLLLFVLLVLSFLNACVRLGTSVTREITSPDNKWDVVLMVRNGGAMTDFSTQISVINKGDTFAKQGALWNPGNIFIADDEHGAVPVDGNGQINVKVAWASASKVIVSYPGKARVFKQEPKFRSVMISYEKLQ
jgi:hypothetical protein